jgi:hypothetical protein
MIDFVDSCSWTNLPADILKYVSALSGFGYELATGRNQFAYYAFNCSATYTKILTAQNNRYESFSFNVAPLNPTNGPAEVNIRAWSTATGCIATVTLTKAGRLTIRVGGDGFGTLGALAYTSQTVLTPGVWYSIDLAWYFPSSGNGWCNIYINDVLDTSPLNPAGPSANNINWGAVPDRFSHVMINSGGAQSGWLVCDLAMSNGQGAFNNARLGPVQVKFYPFQQDQFIQWGIPFPPTLAATVDAISEYPGSYPTPDHVAPDEDASYINATTTLIENLYGIPSIDCYAGILGLALNATIRDPNNGAIDFVVRPQPSAGSAGEIVFGGTGGSYGPDTPPSYATVQGILEQLNGGTIVDGGIENAWWGIKCITGTPFVTQLFLEKVTTRRALPYQCGQLGSYCVGGS